jgi:hypothetical protein
VAIIFNNKILTINSAMGLMKVFSGNEILALALQERIEEIGITTVIRNNNQSNVLPSIENAKAIELFIQETDFSKANAVIEEFRLSI